MFIWTAKTLETSAAILSFSLLIAIVSLKYKLLKALILYKVLYRLCWNRSIFYCWNLQLWFLQPCFLIQMLANLLYKLVFVEAIKYTVWIEYGHHLQLLHDVIIIHTLRYVTVALVLPSRTTYCRTRSRHLGQILINFFCHATIPTLNYS